nr:MAG TPA: hypothetical protein [Caudoviricetes sp.]
MPGNAHPWYSIDRSIVTRKQSFVIAGING